MKAWWIVVAWIFFAGALWAAWAHDPWLIFISLLNAVTATRAGATEVRYRRRIRKLEAELGEARYHQDLPEATFTDIDIFNARHVIPSKFIPKKIRHLPGCGCEECS